MKPTALILLLACTAATALAQDDIKPPKRKYEWDKLHFRHEISLDISPVITGVSTSYTRILGVGFTYRNFFGNRTAYRLGYRSTFYIDRTEGYTSQSYRAIAPGQTDSLIVTHYYNEESEPIHLHTLRAGIEHRFGKRRVKFVLGLDAFFGFEKYHRNGYTYYYERTVTFDPSGAPVEVLDSYHDYPVVYTHYDQLSFAVGFAPIIGMHFGLTPRWSLDAAMIPDFYWYFPFKHSSSSNYFTNHYETKGFSGISDAFLADISLTFHF